MPNAVNALLLAGVVFGTGGLTLAGRAARSTDPPPPPAVVFDPRMTAAVAARERLTDHEARLADRMHRLLARLADAKGGGQHVDPSAAAAELRGLLGPLYALARQAQDEHHRLTEDAHEFVRELRHAPAGYAQAATAWRERAADYRDAGLRALPLGYAADCEALASAYRDRLADAEGFAAQLEELRPYLRETQQALHDLRLYLDQTPDIGAVDPGRRYARYLEQYARAHAAFQAVLDDYLALLRTPLPSDPALPTAATRDKTQ